MRYDLLSVYSNKKTIKQNNSVLISENNKIYEFEDLSLNIDAYHITKSKISIDSSELPLNSDYRAIKIVKNFLFICYKRSLNIFNRKTKAFYDIQSQLDILIGDCGFLLSDKTFFIVTLSAACVIVPEAENILNFEANGLLFTLESVENSEFLDLNDRGNLNQFLSLKSIKDQKIFKLDGECLFKFNEYCVFKESACIQNIVSVTSLNIQIEDKNISSDVDFIDSQAVIVLCKNHLFVILDNLIVKKEIDPFYTKIDTFDLSICNYFQKTNFNDCFLLLSCFKTIKFIKTFEMEKYILNFINNEIIYKFIQNLIFNSEKFKIFDYRTILCRVYRLVDDKGRQIIDSFIDSNDLKIDQLFYLIIYKEEQLDKFILLCKEQKRLFYLVELKEFYIKTGKEDFCRRKLLQHGLMIFEYEGFEQFNQIEKQQIESQRLMYLMKNN